MKGEEQNDGVKITFFMRVEENMRSHTYTRLQMKRKKPKHTTLHFKSTSMAGRNGFLKKLRTVIFCVVIINKGTKVH